MQVTSRMPDGVITKLIRRSIDMTYQRTKEGNANEVRLFSAVNLMRFAQEALEKKHITQAEYDAYYEVSKKVHDELKDSTQFVDYSSL